MILSAHIHIARRFRISGAIPILLLCTFTSWAGHLHRYHTDFVSTSQQLVTSCRYHNMRTGSIWIFSGTNCSPFAFVVTTFPGGSRHWLHYNGASRERKLGSRSMLPSPSISHSFQDSPPLHDNSRISAVQHRNRQTVADHARGLFVSGVRHAEAITFAIMFKDSVGR